MRLRRKAERRRSSSNNNNNNLLLKKRRRLRSGVSFWLLCARRGAVPVTGCALEAQVVAMTRAKERAVAELISVFGFKPRSFVAKETSEYMRPSVQVDLEQPDKYDTVTDIYVRGKCPWEVSVKDSKPPPRQVGRKL